VLAAQLVVNAAGRGNRGPRWLAELGFETPQEQKVDPRLVYVTACFVRTSDDYDGIGAAIGPTVDKPCGGVALAIENDKWMVTLHGIGGLEPPVDPKEFVEWAAHLPNPDVHQIIAGAEIVERPVRMRIPPSLWRRYDKVARLPAGYVAVGDAVCALNPAFGQGMTTAALEALALRECLDRGLSGLTPRFFARTAKIIATPWAISVNADLRFSETAGKRSVRASVLNWYLGRLHRLAERDGSVGTAFLRVANLLDSPQRLFAPALAVKVLRG
jgi:flavin-dependent dehydrogenase